MYSAFYIQPKVEKEKRIIRCDPFVQKYTVAVFILRVQRRKDKMGGVIVGEGANLKKCWDMIEQNDGMFSDDMEKVMMAIAEIAMANKCTVVFQQAGDEPTFSNAFGDDQELINNVIEAQARLDKFSKELLEAGVFVHINPTEYFDIDEVDSKVVFRISHFAVGSHPDIADKVNSVIDAKYPVECIFTFNGNAGSSASVMFGNHIKLHVLSNAGTQDRFLISASLFMTPDQANSVFVDYKNKSIATSLFKQIVTAGNIFVPKNVARGVVTKVGIPTPDAVMFDLSIEHTGTKMLPVLQTLFEADKGARGAVLAYGFEGGVKDKLFLLKGPLLTSEGPALDRCWEIIKELYQEEAEPAAPGAPSAPATEMKKPNMVYFKFRL